MKSKKECKKTKRKRIRAVEYGNNLERMEDDSYLDRRYFWHPIKNNHLKN